jgi:hypothetical protein
MGGKVSGVVCRQTVALQASSHVDGDVHHCRLRSRWGPSSRAASSCEERGRPDCGYRWKRRSSSTCKRLSGMAAGALRQSFANEVSVQRQLGCVVRLLPAKNYTVRGVLRRRFCLPSRAAIRLYTPPQSPGGGVLLSMDGFLECR